jgi:hypothetical protein
MRYVVEADDINKFKFCPYCGSDWVSVYDGDFCGQTECLECEDELEFTILEEFRDRFPDRFKKSILD